MDAYASMHTYTQKSTLIISASQIYYTFIHSAIILLQATVSHSAVRGYKSISCADPCSKHHEASVLHQSGNQHTVPAKEPPYSAIMGTPM